MESRPLRFMNDSRIVGVCERRFTMAGFLWVGMALALGAEDGPMKWNLVAIVTDDQSEWSVGCYGNRDSRTPSMDRLATEGARFRNAFVTTPVCSPSRAAYMTGRWGTEVSITDYISANEYLRGVGLPPGTTLWPALLQKQGYKTAMIGKWHLGGEPHQSPNKLGFNHFFGEPKGSFAPLNPTLIRNGVPEKTKGYSADVITDEALAWLGSVKNAPFAMCLHFREPHLPYTPVSPADGDLFTSSEPAIPDEPGLDQEQTRRWTREYYAAIHAVDRNLGRVLAELDKLGIADRTIVMFTSDHGYNIGHHVIHTKGNGWWMAGGVRGPKRPNMWDNSIRVPLLVRWPGVVKGGTVIDEWVANIDMFPTVLGMLQIPDPELTLRGQDYSPLLRGEGTWVSRQELFGQYDLHNGGLAYMRMVRTPEWKLVRHYHSEGLDELYHLARDPGETRNLYEATGHEKVKADLQARLDAWMKSIDDPLLSADTR